MSASTARPISLVPAVARCNHEEPGKYCANSTRAPAPVPWIAGSTQWQRWDPSPRPVRRPQSQSPGPRGPLKPSRGWRKLIAAADSAAAVPFFGCAADPTAWLVHHIPPVAVPSPKFRLTPKAVFARPRVDAPEPARDRLTRIPPKFPPPVLPALVEARHVCAKKAKRLLLRWASRAGPPGQ